MPESAELPHELIGAQSYARLPDDGWRTELVRGRVVREPQPGFEHGRLQARIVELLRNHIREVGLDLICVGNVGALVAEDPDTVRGPDVAVVRRDRVPAGSGPGFLRGAPDLAVEVVSPSNSAAELQEKVAEYLGGGARCVWVVYPATRTVVVNDSVRTATVIRHDEPLLAGDVLPGLPFTVGDLFQD
jgi:Uma2 family endonuclease